MVKNGRVLFNEHPTGFPIPGKTVVYDESEDIDIENLPLEGRVLIKVLILSIDPYMRGRMNATASYTAGYTIGKPITSDGLGKVLRSDDSSIKVGSYVTGTFPHVEYYISKEPNQLRVLDNKENIPLTLYVGLAGMPGKTSWMAWKEYSKAKAGETVFISGGAGPVGSFVAQIAKKQGLKVIASAGTDSKVEFLRQIGVDVAFNYKTTDTREVLSKEGPIDIYWDNVGGETLEAALDHAALYARFIECGMISKYNSSGEAVGIRNLHLIYGKSITMQGFVVFRLYEKYNDAFYAEVPALLASGAIKYKEHITRGLENVGQAIVDVQKGDNEGKSVVIVAEE